MSAESIKWGCWCGSPALLLLQQLKSTKTWLSQLRTYTFCYQSFIFHRPFYCFISCKGEGLFEVEGRRKKEEKKKKCTALGTSKWSHDDLLNTHQSAKNSYCGCSQWMPLNVIPVKQSCWQGHPRSALHQNSLGITIPVKYINLGFLLTREKGHFLPTPLLKAMKEQGCPVLLFYKPMGLCPSLPPYVVGQRPCFQNWPNSKAFSICGNRIYN